MSDYRDRIDAIAASAREDRRAFEPPTDPPAEERAVRYLREGVGEVVAVYVEARTGDFVPLDADEMSRLERALNDWLELYARCHGRTVDPAVTVREIAEAVIETRDLVESARLLTGVPDRDGTAAWRETARNN